MQHRHRMSLAAGWVIAGLMIVLSVAVSGAQGSNDELFAFYEGDLWAWQPGEAPEQLTTWGYNSGPVLSPDGRTIAYRSVASEAVREIEGAVEGITYAGDAPANIYLMDVATRDFERIAQQSALRIWRSSPVWSPDSTRLAWTEMRGELQPSVDVVMYDTRDGSTRSVATLEMGFQDGGLVMPFLQWSERGIARLVYTFSGRTPGDDAQNEPNLYWDIVNPDVGSVSRFEVGGLSDPNRFVLTWFWAEHQGQDQIVYADRSNTWYVLNVQTGARESLANPPLLVRADGDASTALIPGLLDPQSSPSVAWDYRSAGNTTRLPFQTYTLGSGLGLDPVLSEDGRSVAWSDFGTVQVWQSGSQSVQTILESPQMGRPVNLGPMSLVWSPMRWITDGAVSAPPPPPTPAAGSDACALPPQLQVGMAVTVASGQEPNRVRTQPSLSSTRLGLLFPGEVAIVQEGPVCAAGLYWWRVSNAAFDGWTVEGADGVYWLVPAG